MRGIDGGRLLITLAALSLLLSTMASPSAVAATSTTTAAASSPVGATPSALVLTVIPPELPADGGTYRAIVVSLQSFTSAPSVALDDTVVFLTSSHESVGTVTSQVVILQGSAFTIANFTTSATPGVTSISASSSGLSAASAPVTTKTPSGFATTLNVIPVPGTQLANPTSQGTVLVETLDSAGLPAKTSSSITVTLSSSDNGVVSLPSGSLTIASGSVLSSGTYDVGVLPGTATITGSASGFNSGSGTVTVQGASPYALSIFAQPDPIATSTTGRLVVTLTDPGGNPAPAPAPIPVTITSSNTSAISSVQTTTIPMGQIYAVAAFTSGASPGYANLTASSPGLMSDFAVVTVSSPVQPARLELIAAPNPVLADEGSYDSLVVELTDAGGDIPAVTSSGVSVTLASSDSAVGSVEGSLSIPSGSSYAVASFSSTFFVGSTTITASAQNLQSASARVSSYGPIPTKVVVQALPSSLPADGGAYPALEVMLEDASGLPAVAPVGVSVQLASSDTDIATVNSTVVIAAGQSYVLTGVQTTISPGTASMTATSSGFQSSSTTFTTASPAPSQLGVYVAPASGIQSPGKGDAVLAVQLQDSTSSPARARQDTLVVVTSSNSSVISKPITLDIPPGGDYAFALLSTVQPGASVLTASTGGLSSSSASISVLSLPVSVTLTSSAPIIAIGTAATVQLQILVNGAPLQGANVSFSATSGSMSATSGVTDSGGQFTDTFIPLEKGVATISAVVQDPLIGNQTAGTNILITAPGAAGTGGSAAARGLGVLGTILPIVIVLVVIVVVAFGARRVLKNRGAPEEGEGTDVEGA